MSPLRLSGSTSGYSQLDAPAVAGDQTFTLPGTGGTLDRLNRAGNILQVVQTVKTDNFTTSSTTFTDITGLSASITPSSSSNKILILGDVSVGGANGAYLILQLVRSSTAIYIGTDSKTLIGSKAWYPFDNTSNNTVGNLNLLYLDSPATASSVPYKIQIRMSAAIAGGINRRNSLDDTSLASSITLMEVAA